MTRVEWDAEWQACFSRLRAKGYDPAVAQKMAREITRARYGPQPAKPPLWLRVALKVAGRKLGTMRSVEEKTMKQKLMNSVVFGVAAVFAALQVSGLPTDEKGWFGLVGVFFAAAYGKFSSNTTMLAPSREIWSEEKREEKLNGGGK